MNTVLILIEKYKNSAQVYWVNSEGPISESFLKELSNEPDTILIKNPPEFKYDWNDVDANKVSLINFLPGVTDNPAHIFKEMLELFHENKSFSVHSGKLFWGEISFDFNELIQQIKVITKNQLYSQGLPRPNEVNLFREIKVQEFNLCKMNLSELIITSNENKWALNENELLTIKEHYQNSKTQNVRSQLNLSHSATDVELEIIAQSWSEHCKHKIFNAEIDYSDAHEKFSINGLYKTYIKGSTFKINRPWAVSVFKDNAGVVDWDSNNYLAIKVETHNSPSALDPYGGALTGILGVNRDILGTGMGFMPLANTDVFCVGEWDEDDKLPNKIIHPQNILKGIHRGVQDGGNKSGIPTVNGAICFNENFTGKPLVYCGTIGISPKNSLGTDNKEKYQEADDLIIMAGGRVGLDGIHGATMSSIVLDESVPKTMVQIGDPFTQKKLSDFILACRDQSLMTGLTDNGAGGLSSSIGEMAEKTNGAILFLDKVPLKYPGLSPWEIMVSESQERMSLSIKSHNLEKIQEVAMNFGVEISVIGKFTSDGLFKIFYFDKCVGAISLDFLHNGLPPMKLKAKWGGAESKLPSWKKPLSKLDSNNIEQILKTIIQDKNIVSKDKFIKQYDHEVKAATIVKPLDGISRNSPNDSGVLKLENFNGDSNTGLAIASGIAYQFSHIDTALMTKLAFDEAMRSVIAVGANPNKIAMTDNFCWPDPLPSKHNPDAEHKLAQLVRSCRALHDIALNYEVPLISGKDSMKNDYIDETIKISIPPTLLMTAIGHVEDLSLIKKTAIKEASKKVYLLGIQHSDKYFGYFLEKYFNFMSSNDFNWNTKDSFEFYKKYSKNINLIDSCHDVGEGGVLISLCECLFTQKLGIKFEGNWKIESLFSEYPTQFIVSVNRDNIIQFENVFTGNFKLIGETTTDFKLSGITNENIDLSEIEKLWGGSW